MDTFNIGVRLGTVECWTLLLKAKEALDQPAAFIDDNTFEILRIVAPERRATLITAPSLGPLYTAGDTAAMPPSLRAVCYVCEGRLVFCYTALLGLVIHQSDHYSLLLVDLPAQKAYHYDSYPQSNHSQAAIQLARNLCLAGILNPADADGNGVHATVSFVQASTSCAIFVLLALSCVETALNQPTMGSSREDIILAALGNAQSEQAVREMRTELSVRMRAAISVLYNALVADPESDDQALALGPMCCRRSMRALVTPPYHPTVQLLQLALSDALPPGMVVTFHSVPDTQPEALCSEQTMHELQQNQLVLLVLTSGDRVSLCTLLLNAPAGRYLFVPTMGVSADVSRCLTTMRTVLGAECIQLGANLAHTNNAGVFPLMLVAWWQRVGVYDQLVNDAQALAEALMRDTHMLSKSIRTTGFTYRHDWFNRRALGAAMSAAYTQLSALDAHEDESAQCRSAMTGMRRHYERVSDARLRARTSDAAERDMQRVLADAVDRGCEEVCRLAPVNRWFSGGDLVELQYLYRDIACDPNTLTLISVMEGVVRAARRLAATVGDTRLSQQIVAPFMKELFVSWPALLVGPDIGGEIHAVGPTSEKWIAMLECEFFRAESDQCGLLICPVAQFSAGDDNAVTVGRYIDVILAMEMYSKDLLVPRPSYALARKHKLSMEALGGGSLHAQSAASRATSSLPTEHRLCPLFVGKEAGNRMPFIPIVKLQ